MKIKDILKWLILIIIFIIVTFLFFKIVTYMMKPASVDLNNIAGFYGEKKESLDMVYIGGSACFVYWEPLRAFEKEGIASYNYAANTIQVELYKTMVTEILKTQKPKLIILDARALQYRENDKPPEEVVYRNVLTGMPASLNKFEFIHNNVKRYLGEEEKVEEYYFDIMKFHRDTKGMTIDNQIKMAFGNYENNIKGFYFVPKVEKMPENKKYDTTEKISVDEETEKILIDLLEHLKTTDCNYLFVVSPYIEQEEHKKVFNYCEEIIKNYGYDFLDSNDYYEEMGINFDTDFYNEAHVNIFGAEKYTDFLASYIKQNYNLPNRKEEYTDWVELLPEWNKLVEEDKATINELIGEGI